MINLDKTSKNIFYLWSTFSQNREPLNLPYPPPPPPNKCEERSQKPKQTQTKMQQGVLIVIKRIVLRL